MFIKYIRNLGSLLIAMLGPSQNIKIFNKLFKTGVVQTWAAIIMGILAGIIPWVSMMVLHKKLSFLQKVCP